MRAAYKEISNKINEYLVKAETLLLDKTIDNTLEGAKKRLQDFYNYKETLKPLIIKEQVQQPNLFIQIVLSEVTNLSISSITRNFCNMSQFKLNLFCS